MSRSIFTIKCSGNPASLENKINTLLIERGFFSTIYKRGEKVWKKGVYLATPKFVKIEYGSSELTVSVWIGATLGPAESGIEGNVLGAMSKEQLINIVNAIQMLASNQESYVSDAPAVPQVSNNPVHHTMIRCMKCGAELSANSKFCSNCGEKVASPKKCPQCGNEIKPGEHFCNQCGTKIG